MEAENILIKKAADDFISSNAQKYDILSGLFNLTNENYLEILQQIKDHKDLFFKDHPSSIFFFYNIIQASKYNFKSLELLMDICVLFSTEIKSTSTTDAELITICYNYSNCLNYLFYKNFFTIESIVEKSFSNNEIFITFYPEIEAHDSEYAKIGEKKLFQNNINDRLTEYFKFVKSNPKQHILYRQLSYHPSPLHKSIREDDIETFQSLLSKNNFSINHKIEYSFYERLKTLIDDNLSLIKIAAMYGSIQVFKFLWFQSNIEIDDNLIVYGYAGKNFEIIHLCETKCPKDDVFFQPIFTHRQDLLDYYIDNFGDEIHEDRNDITEKMTNYIKEEDNVYEILNYNALAAALFTSNFDVIKPCLKKIIFILRNIENVNHVGCMNYEFLLLANSLFDLDLFKFLFSQRKESVKKIECFNYMSCLMYSIKKCANDTCKFLLNELNDIDKNKDKNSISLINSSLNVKILLNSLEYNNDIVNFIIDSEKVAIDNEIFGMELLSPAFDHYNENTVVKALRLFKFIFDDESNIVILVESIIKNLSTKMILSLINQILTFLSKNQLIEMANQFKNQNRIDLYDHIFNKFIFYYDLFFQ